MDVSILRGIERIFVVCFSGLAIYLGYRLFSQIPEKADAQGKVVLPGGISIYMTRVGPGAFFALFGLIVLALSLYFSVEIQKGGNTPANPANSSPHASSGEVYRGFGQQNKTADDLSKERLSIRPDMYQLNNLMGLLRNDIKEPERGDVETLIKNIKLKMIYSVWSDDWGDYKLFKEWTDGFLADLPENQEEAAKLYSWGASKEKQ